jgi:hypothetical protein
MRTRIAILLITTFAMGFAIPAHSQNVPTFFQGMVTQANRLFTNIAPGDAVSGSYALPASPDSSLPIPGFGNLWFVDLVGGNDFSLTMAGGDAILAPIPLAVLTATLPFNGFDLWQLFGEFNHNLIYPPPGLALRCSVGALLFPALGNVDYFVFNGALDGNYFGFATFLTCEFFDPSDILAPGIFVLQAQIGVSGLMAYIRSIGISECTSPDGAIVTLDGSISSGPPDAAFSWVDDSSGQVIGTEAVIDVQAPLGSTSYTLTIAAGGATDSASALVRVRDTTAPQVVAELVPAGDNAHKYTVVAEATDVCDAELDLQSIVGASVNSGSSATIARPEETGTLRLEGENLHLEVSAIDDSGNKTTETAMP